MRKGIFSVALSTVLTCGGAAVAQQNQEAAVIKFDGGAQDMPQTAAKPAVVEQKLEQVAAEAPIAEQRFVSDEPPAVPAELPKQEAAKDRYRFHNGQWWYQADDGQWLWRNGSRWVPYQPRNGRRGPAITLTARQAQAPAAGGAAPASGGATGQPMASESFNSMFNAYRGFQTGRGSLGTAESGQVEMATSLLGAAESEAAEAVEFGGIPGSQARRRRPGVGRAMNEAAWFNAGSPFGIRYGYGSGFGYGGYGFNNPYGYGPRTGSGGAFAYGFAPYGSVGGQTGDRLGSLIGGSEAGGRLIGSETASFAAPSRLEAAVGGSYGSAGAGARKLGGSASERD